MTDKKSQILDEIRSRLERKYAKNGEDLKDWIKVELSKLSRKEKLRLDVYDIFSSNPKDLNELDDKISTLSRATMSQDERQSQSTIVKMKKSTDSPMRYSSSFLFKTTPKKAYGIPDGAINNIYPTDLKVLEKHKSITSTPTIRHSSMTPMNLAPLMETPKMLNSIEFTTPNGTQTIKKVASQSHLRQKSLDRESSLQNNIWARIDKFNYQERVKEEEIRRDRIKDMKKNWIETLNKQMEEQMTKKKEQVQKEREEINALFKIDEQKDRERDENFQKHVSNIKKRQRGFLDEAKEIIDAYKSEDSIEKIKEKEEMKKIAEDIQKDREAKQLKKKADQIKYKEWQDQLAAQKQYQKEKIKLEEQEVDKINNEYQYQYRDQQDALLAEKTNKVRKILDIDLGPLTSPTKSKWNGPREEGFKIVNKIENSPEYKLQKKIRDKEILQSTLDSQIHEREAHLQKERVLEKQFIMQEDTEEGLNREGLEKKAEALKRKIQKEQLDEQIKMNKELKKFYVDPELWVNKKTLKKINKSQPFEAYYKVTDNE